MKKKVRQVVTLARRFSFGDGTDRSLLERFRERYEELASEQRLELFHWLSGQFEVGLDTLEEPMANLRKATENDCVAWNENVRELRKAIASPRQRLLEALINTTGGMEFVLALRAEVIDAQRLGEKGLEALEEDVAHLLNRWCQHGLLFLEEIDLSAPFETIRFLKEREMVHPMVGLEEMGQRLGEDRLCFALYHVAMPKEPVVFIEVALSRGLMRSIHDVIDDSGSARERVNSPDTAIFYSINNTQIGLAGLGLGKVLIMRVTEALRERHPSLKTYATLSPIPGFWPRYLRPILQGRDEKFAMKRTDVLEVFSDKSREAIAGRYRELRGEGKDFAETVFSVLDRSHWIDDSVFAQHLRKPLSELAFTYIGQEKDPRGRPLNPVAGFHLGNGARVSRNNVNFAANTSERGLSESCGLMVNYIYSQKALAPFGRAVRSLLPWGR
ncbi:MAG: malonyl-CoA decarboxylase family protein [Acidobacteriota bacterium]